MNKKKKEIPITLANKDFFLFLAGQTNGGHCISEKKKWIRKGKKYWSFMPIRTFSCAKLMVIIVFLEKKACEKEKKNQSFFQIRIMFMPWGCLKNEFGCYQFKVSFGINEGFIDYFSLILFCTKLRNVLSFWHFMW